MTLLLILVCLRYCKKIKKTDSIIIYLLYLIFANIEVKLNDPKNGWLMHKKSVRWEAKTKVFWNTFYVKTRKNKTVHLSSETDQENWFNYYLFTLLNFRKHWSETQWSEKWLTNAQEINQMRGKNKGILEHFLC
jgi:hypothetical protein